jgi:hypothetical protein
MHDPGREMTSAIDWLIWRRVDMDSRGMIFSHSTEPAETSLHGATRPHYVYKIDKLYRQIACSILIYMHL